MVFVYVLAQERGRRPRRWVLVASLIGPFAIPAIYLAAATSAFRKMIDVPEALKDDKISTDCGSRLRVKTGRPSSFKEKARITLGAMVALVIVGWIFVIGIATTSVR